MQRVLQPIGGLSPQITDAGAYGAVNGRKPPSSIPHGGVDFNYPVGQTRINLTHPALRSPVAGIVTDAEEGAYGRIAISFTHGILHTRAQHVAVSDPVVAGQLLGTMGNTGTKAVISVIVTGFVGAVLPGVKVALGK